MMNSFILTLSEKHFICPSILNDSFAGYSNVGCRPLASTQACALTGNQTCDPKGLQSCAQSTGPHQPGPTSEILGPKNKQPHIPNLHTVKQSGAMFGLLKGPEQEGWFRQKALTLFFSQKTGRLLSPGTLRVFKAFSQFFLRIFFFSCIFLLKNCSHSLSSSSVMIQARARSVQAMATLSVASAYLLATFIASSKGWREFYREACPTGGSTALV